MRCADHNAICSLICQVNDCPKRLLCNQCMLRHNPQHYSMIQSIQDMEYTITQVPVLIERDLDKVKTKLYQIQNHLVLEKENLKKQFLKMVDVLKSRLSADIDEFCSNTLDYANSYYRQFETDISTLVSVIANHVTSVVPYATRVRPLNENQFQTLMEFQERMLTNIMPTIQKKAELLSKTVFENPLHMKIDHFYALVKTYLDKALRPYNLFNNNEHQIDQKKMLQLKIDEPVLAKSSLLPINPEYKQQARELLRDHYHSLERHDVQKSRKSTRTGFNLPSIRSSTELRNPIFASHVYNHQRTLNTILSGHTDIVNCVCVFNETQLISGAGGGAIRVWDMESGISIGQMNEHAGDIWALAKINETHFASGSSDQTVRIWNFQRLICESVLVGHVEPIRALVYMRDLDFLASGSMDMSIKIWAVGRAKLKMTIQDSQKVKALCYIEIKGLVLSGGSGGAIKVFNVLNGYCRDQLEGHQGDVCAVQHLQDTMLGEQVSIAASGGADRKVIIWNVDKSLKLQVFVGHQDSVYGLAYDRENQQLWSAGGDRTLRVWDLVRGKQGWCIKRHSEQISCIEFVKSRELVVTGSWDHRVRVTSRSVLLA